MSEKKDQLSSGSHLCVFATCYSDNGKIVFQCPRPQEHSAFGGLWSAGLVGGLPSFSAPSGGGLRHAVRFFPRALCFALRGTPRGGRALFAFIRKSCAINSHRLFLLAFPCFFCSRTPLTNRINNRMATATALTAI